MREQCYWCVTETAFQASLSVFLKSLGLDVETLLHGVDFSQLSPAVHLISTVPGLFVAAAQGVVCHDFVYPFMF